MSIRIMYFVHGTTIDNEKHFSSGWKDVELSELGKDQSLKLKDLLQGRKFDAVFCSDLSRAFDTATLVWGKEVLIVQDPRLRECNYGDFNGQPSEIVEPLQEKKIKDSFPNGESYEDVKVRMESFLDFLKMEYDGMTIAIVAHKAPQLALEVLLNGKTWERAFSEDWRKKGEWQPGWEYVVS